MLYPLLLEVMWLRTKSSSCPFPYLYSACTLSWLSRCPEEDSLVQGHIVGGRDGMWFQSWLTINPMFRQIFMCFYVTWLLLCYVRKEASDGKRNMKLLVEECLGQCALFQANETQLWGVEYKWNSFGNWMHNWKTVRERCRNTSKDGGRQGQSGHWDKSGIVTLLSWFLTTIFICTE